MQFYVIVSHFSNYQFYVSYMVQIKESPFHIFARHEVLGMSNAIDEGGSDFKWWLVLCLLGAWIVVFFALIKGIKSSGKAML